ncbi:unnamed protein product [Heligmosomoides polygyrus]|uniref:Protein Wnt n=1 Tax=Heligmosomoides polygyrus TaxID=6339 RepID=A0A183GF73_HELPZ|nr:unnamed protein product [Heligmosomoides polygyrus]
MNCSGSSSKFHETYRSRSGFANSILSGHCTANDIYEKYRGTGCTTNNCCMVSDDDIDGRHVDCGVRHDLGWKCGMRNIFELRSRKASHDEMLRNDYRMTSCKSVLYDR